MTTTEKGRLYEGIAAKKLEEEGYTILERNYHSVYGEIDIIASNDKVIAFVEVRQRKTGAQVSAVYSITRTKIHKICKTAAMYMAGHKTNLAPRFDVIAITTKPNGDIIDYNHLKGAFDYEVSYNPYENF